MKNRIKALITYNALMLVLAFGLVACGVQEVFTKDESEDMNDENFDKRKDERDAQFLVNAAEIYMEEIGLARLAQEKGTTSPIKELGRTMEQDHQKSLDELTTLAKRKKMTIPNTITDQGDDSYRLLNEKIGDDFNETYANLMVKKHEDAISIFEKAANKSRDKQIKEWANSMLVVLRRDMSAAQSCASQFDKN
jgi:putative membrane protein